MCDFTCLPVQRAHKPLPAASCPNDLRTPFNHTSALLRPCGSSIHPLSILQAAHKQVTICHTSVHYGLGFRPLPLNRRFAITFVFLSHISAFLMHPFSVRNSGSPPTLLNAMHGMPAWQNLSSTDVAMCASCLREPMQLGMATMHRGWQQLSSRHSSSKRELPFVEGQFWLWLLMIQLTAFCQ